MGWVSPNHSEIMIERTRLMGVVNITPDSFSDGGHFLALESAIAHALRLVEEGADLLDLGAESSRPGAHPISAGEELGRLRPILLALAGRIPVPISILCGFGCGALCGYINGTLVARMKLPPFIVTLGTWQIGRAHV